MYRNILFSVQYSLLGAQRSQENKISLRLFTTDVSANFEVT